MKHKRKWYKTVDKIIVIYAEKDERWRRKDELNKAFAPDEDIIFRISNEKIQSIFTGIRGFADRNLFIHSHDILLNNSGEQVTIPTDETTPVESVYYGYFSTGKRSGDEWHLYYTKPTKYCSDPGKPESLTFYYYNRPFCIFSSGFQSVNIGLSRYNNSVLDSSAAQYIKKKGKPLNAVAGIPWGSD